MNVPYLNHAREARAHLPEILALIEGVAASSDFILKGRVKALEAAITSRTNARHAVATSSATGAIRQVLHAWDVRPGAEVILPAYGFPSPAACVMQLGATPVFIDVDPLTGVMDPRGIKQAITARTKAIIAVHLGTALAEMACIAGTASEYGLKLVEDSAVALGASVSNVPAGRWGDAGVFSFFPTKPLGGIADGGMLVTDDDELAFRCRRLRNHGQDDGIRFVYREIGWNSRMDEIAAGYLLLQLARFDAAVARRQAIIARYDEACDELGGAVFALGRHGRDRGHHAYAIAVGQRGALLDYLRVLGIEARPFYPVPLHLQPAFRVLGYRADQFPGAESLSERTMALPLYSALTDAEVEHVTASLVKFHG
jgi:dTDP-4-amino-4,6-dideoxygalactose transaminase